MSTARTDAHDLLLRSDIAGDVKTWDLSRTTVTVGGRTGQTLPPTRYPPPTVNQPEGHPISTNSPQSAAVQLVNGDFWGVYTVPHPDDPKRVALRWWRVRASKTNLIGHGILADPELSFFNPSIAVDAAGNIVIGCSGVSAKQFLSAYAIAGRVDGDKVVFNPAFQLIKAGTGERAKSIRWGDYTTTVADPAAPGVFWTFQPYAQDNGDWATEITQLTLAGR